MSKIPNQLAKEQAFWYKKLKDETDFVDIENADGQLKIQSAFFNGKKSIIQTASSRLEYYNMARKFIYDYKFKNKLEKIIWEYHSEGLSLNEIKDTLIKAKVWSGGKSTVWDIIDRLRNEMKDLYMRQADNE